MLGLGICIIGVLANKIGYDAVRDSIATTGVRRDSVAKLCRNIINLVVAAGGSYFEWLRA